MTKEEIRQAAQDWDGSGMATPAEEGAFIKGAEWMQERMIEKAVEWLDKNVDSYCFNTGNRYEYIPKVGGKMLEDFKQAMQDESK